MKAPQKRGGSLQCVRGVVPVEVAAEVRTLVAIDEFTKGSGKYYPIEGGGQMRFRMAQTVNRQTAIEVHMPSNALWAYDSSEHRFELTYAKGRRYYLLVQGYPMYGQMRPADALLLMAGPPAAGLSAFPWPGIVLNRPPLGKQLGWIANLTFTAPEGVGPPARLTLQRVRRMKVEVPFAFHDLPLP